MKIEIEASIFNTTHLIEAHTYTIEMEIVSNANVSVLWRKFIKIWHLAWKNKIENDDHVRKRETGTI